MSRLVDEIINYTKEKIISQEEGSIQLKGNRPYYPVSIFLFGSTAFSHYQGIRGKLKSYWPAYMSVVRFFYVDDFNQENYEDIKAIDIVNGEVSIQETSLVEQIDSEFDESNGMVSSNKLLAYAIYDSSDIKDEGQLEGLFKSINLVREELNLIGYNELFAVFHVLNERGRGVAGKIKEVLKTGNYFADTSNYILSNRFHNRTTLMPKNDDRYGLIASLIAVSDDGSNDGGFFNLGLFTVKYSRIEKDYSSMAIATVSTLLKCVHSKRSSIKTTFTMEEILGQLGLSVYCKFMGLESIVTSKKVNLGYFIPYLPRKQRNDFNIPITMNMTEQNIDELTMGGWSALARYVAEMITREVNETPLGIKAKAEYQNFLISSMNVYQLAYIKNNFSAIKENIDGQVVKRPEGAPIGNLLNVAPYYYVAENPKSADVYYEALYEVSENAEKCEKTLNELLNELAAIPETKNQELSNMINWFVSEYLKNHPDKIDSLFKIVDSDRFMKEIYSILDKILELDVFDDDILGLVQKMINNNNDEAGSYIWEKLYKNLADRQYVATLTQLTSPRLSVVITQKGTTLADVMSKTIGREGFSLYDSGTKNMIESIQLYNIDPVDLVV